MPFRYPVALEVSRRRCLVVGGGDEAERRVRGLLEAEAAITVVAEDVTPGLFELARRGEVTYVARRYRAADLAGAFLVVAAGGDGALNAAVFADAEAAGVLCNTVDDPSRCHFAVPSIVRRGELLLAVSTGGRAPALAKRLRRRLERTFGWEWGLLVALLGEVRGDLLPARPDFRTWAGRWEAALADEDELLALVATGRLDEVRRRVRAHLGEKVPVSPG